MLSRKEYEGIRSIVESKQTMETMRGESPEAISALGSDLSVYYARLSGPMAEIKDEIMNQFLILTTPGEDGAKEMTAAKAEKAAEVMVNAKHEVTRREIEYLMEGLDKLAFAASARVRSMSKEGNY